MKKEREYWHPPQYSPRDVEAIQAMAEGEASPNDQKRVLKWIIEQAAMTYDEPFRPNSPDVISYMLGRRSVGLAIVKLLHLSREVFDPIGSRDFRDDDRGRRQDGRPDGRQDRRQGGRYDDVDRENRRQRPRDDEPYRDG